MAIGRVNILSPSLQNGEKLNSFLLYTGNASPSQWHLLASACCSEVRLAAILLAMQRGPFVVSHYAAIQHGRADQAVGG